MPVNITFLGHAGFLLDDGRHAVAIDPFLTDNPVAKHKPKDIRCQTIALTHGHADHVGDTVAIAKANKAKVLASYELATYLCEQGCDAEGANPGGEIKTDFGYIAFTQAFHSSSYEGRYMGLACGVIVNIGGATFYHTGDTTIFGDMQLIGQVYKPDIAAIPVGDRFVMGPALATRAAELIRPRVAIPMHYGTWPILAPDAKGFDPHGVQVKVLQPGETWRYTT